MLISADEDLHRPGCQAAAEMASCFCGMNALPAWPTSARARQFRRGHTSLNAAAWSSAGFQNSHVHFIGSGVGGRGYQARGGTRAGARGHAHAVRLHHGLRHGVGPGRIPLPSARASRRESCAVLAFSAGRLGRCIRRTAFRSTSAICRQTRAGATASAERCCRGAKGCARQSRCRRGWLQDLHASPRRARTCCRRCHPRWRARRSKKPMRAANWCSRIPRASPAFALRLHAGVDVIVHTTLGEDSPWDAALARR